MGWGSQKVAHGRRRMVSGSERLKAKRAEKGSVA